MSTTADTTRTYEVRTYGCQMNVHDSERLSGLLEDAGFVRHERADEKDASDVADIVVFNTCAVRENADNRLYGNLGHLAPLKAKNPKMQIAVGGCMAQKDRDTVVKKAPWVDVVFGTHNIGSLPALLDRARALEEAQVEILESLDVFPSTLPTRRESAYAAWVSVSVGCNNTCTFCIVPSLRGKEKDRRPGEILAEIEALVAEGVSEITLLGQNVNAYAGEGGLAGLARQLAQIEGLDRIRYTTSHPADMDEALIAAHAELPQLMPYLHLPVQAGSDKILKAMNRAHTAESYLRLVEKIRAARPDIAMSGDFIVGFPGERDADFEATLQLVREVGYAASFTFKYSRRPGTPAAALPGQVAEEVKDERLARLNALIDEQQRAFNAAQVGKVLPVLFEKPGRHPGQLSGRSPYLQAVHVEGPERLIGQIVPVRIETAHKMSLAGVLEMETA